MLRTAKSRITTLEASNVAALHVAAASNGTVLLVVDELAAARAEILEIQWASKDLRLKHGGCFHKTFHFAQLTDELDTINR